MFGAKYSRLKFWIWHIVLSILVGILSVILDAANRGSIDSSNPVVFLAFLGCVLFIMLDLNVIANRIRDYGDNPWNALLVFIPLVDIGVILYYGIVKHKKEDAIQNNQDTTNPSLIKAVKNHAQDIAEDAIQNNQDTTNPSLIKAVKNHAQDIAEDAKENLKEYKEEHLSRKHKVAGTTPTSEHLQSIIIKDKIDEDALYEQAMNEIENDTKVKSLWAKAFAHSEGNEEKTKALYIQYRVENLKKIHEETLQKKIREEKEKRTKKVEEKQADEDHAIATLVDNGYKVNKIYGNKWKIKEPLGGKITIDTLEELIEYARSLSYH